MKIVITGGAGFIGSNLIRYIINHHEDDILNIDKLTYAGNLDSLSDVEKSDKYNFKKIDIVDFEVLKKEVLDFNPDIIMHLAAESHVDRSIDGAREFVNTNVIGTFNLLEISRELYQENKNFRFHHISTDEVYGDLDHSEDFFTEATPYSPSSPYSATKASSDHLVRAWSRTYGLPTLITNCSNNYGPFHFPEKLIPLMILNALSGKKLPVYGDGQQIRDWLYVEDHAKALYTVATKGKLLETYNIGGNNEMKNLDVVYKICDILQELVPKDISYRDLVHFVKDRPGHDKRYAIDATKVMNDLGWQPKETFESGLKKTIEWFLNNEKWWKAIQDGTYNQERLGEV